MKNKNPGPKKLINFYLLKGFTGMQVLMFEFQLEIILIKNSFNTLSLTQF
jgi:hypothetical protein